MNVLSDFILRIEQEILNGRKENEFATYSPEEINKMITDYESKINELKHFTKQLIKQKPKATKKKGASKAGSKKAVKETKSKAKDAKIKVKPVKKEK